jgi:hypothetical protein
MLRAAAHTPTRAGRRQVADPRNGAVMDGTCRGVAAVCTSWADPAFAGMHSAPRKGSDVGSTSTSGEPAGARAVRGPIQYAVGSAAAALASGVSRPEIA